MNISVRTFLGVAVIAVTTLVNAQTWTPVEWQNAGADAASADFSKHFLPSIEEAVSAGKFDPSLFTEVKGLEGVKPTEAVRIYFVSGEKGPEAWKGYRSLFASDGTLLGPEYTHTDVNAAKVVSGDFAEFAGSEKAAYQEGGFAAAGGGTGAVVFSTAAITTPEPGTYTIMVGCLGLGVWMTRRKKPATQA